MPFTNINYVDPYTPSLIGSGGFSQPSSSVFLEVDCAAMVPASTTYTIPPRYLNLNSFPNGFTFEYEASTPSTLLFNGQAALNFVVGASASAFNIVGQNSTNALALKHRTAYRGGTSIGQANYSNIYTSTDYNNFHHGVYTFKDGWTRLYVDGMLLSENWVTDNSGSDFTFVDTSNKPDVYPTYTTSSNGIIVLKQDSGTNNIKLRKIRMSALCLSPDQIFNNYLRMLPTQSVVYVDPIGGGNGSSFASPKLISQVTASLSSSQKIFLQSGSYGDITISGFFGSGSTVAPCFVGVNGSNAAIFNSLTIQSSSCIEFRNITVSGSIYATGSTLLSFKSVRVDGGGVTITDCSGSYYSNNTGIIVNGTTSVKFLNSIFVQTGSAPVVTLDSSSNAKFVHCTFISGSDSLKQINSKAVVTHNCIFAGFTGIARNLTTTSSYLPYWSDGNVYSSGSGGLLAILPDYSLTGSYPYRWTSSFTTFACSNAGTYITKYWTNNILGQSNLIGDANKGRSTIPEHRSLFESSIVFSSSTDYKLSELVPNPAMTGCREYISYGYDTYTEKPHFDHEGNFRDFRNSSERITAGAFNSKGYLKGWFDLPSPGRVCASIWDGSSGVQLRGLFDGQIFTSSGRFPLYWNGLDQNNYPITSSSPEFRVVSHNLSAECNHHMGDDPQFIPEGLWYSRFFSSYVEADSYSGSFALSSGYNEGGYGFYTGDAQDVSKIKGYAIAGSTINKTMTQGISLDSNYVYSVAPAYIQRYAITSSALGIFLFASGSNTGSISGSIDVVFSGSYNGWISATVQRNNNELLISTNNQIFSYHKVSGSLLYSASFSGSGCIKLISDNDLLMSFNNTELRRYTYMTGSFNLTATYPGFSKISGIAVNPNRTSSWAIADSYPTNQVAIFENGIEISTIGAPGGSQDTSIIKFDTFNFNSGAYSTSPIFYSPDNSVTVFDTGHSRWVYTDTNLIPYRVLSIDSSFLRFRPDPRNDTDYHYNGIVYRMDYRTGTWYKFRDYRINPDGSLPELFDPNPFFIGTSAGAGGGEIFSSGSKLFIAGTTVSASVSGGYGTGTFPLVVYEIQNPGLPVRKTGKRLINSNYYGLGDYGSDIYPNAGPMYYGTISGSNSDFIKLYYRTSSFDSDGPMWSNDILSASINLGYNSANPDIYGRNWVSGAPLVGTTRVLGNNVYMLKDGSAPNWAMSVYDFTNNKLIMRCLKKGGRWSNDGDIEGNFLYGLQAYRLYPNIMGGIISIENRGEFFRFAVQSAQTMLYTLDGMHLLSFGITGISTGNVSTGRLYGSNGNNYRHWVRKHETDPDKAWVIDGREGNIGAAIWLISGVSTIKRLKTFLGPIPINLTASTVPRQLSDISYNF